MQEEENKNSNESISNKLKERKIFFSKMTEEETNLWLKELNLEENILTEIEKLIKNGKDLISLYNNNQLIEKLNLDLHTNNILQDAIEEALEEQLKINIEIEKDKNIIINIENEPKYKLKEVCSYLEKLLKKKIFLCPKNTPNEILNPNTLIQKKILLNPNKYCNLCLFNEIIIGITPKSDIKNDKINTNINTNVAPIDMNIKQIPEIKNEKKESNKAYTSLFQNKKKNIIPDFTTDYQMPSLNKINNDITNNINNLANNNDFKYQNILSNKEKDKEKENKFKKDFDINTNNINTNNINNINNNNEQKKGFPNFNIINNTDTNINKNYFTQRNFNTKNFSFNDKGDNGDIFSKITNFKLIERTKNNNNNIEKEKILDNLDTNNNNIKNNKTENRYEFVKYQELDIFKNQNNLYNMNNNLPKQDSKPSEVNDINNLILKTQNTNLNKTQNIPTKKKDESDDILKSLREKYSLQNNGNELKEINLEYKKDYKPKTPIAEGRRTFNNDNMQFNLGEENSNDPLENKFLNINQNRTNKNEEFDKYSFITKTKVNTFNIGNEQDEQNNNGFGGMGKIRNNRPSPGLDFNNFQYKASGYKSSFGQNIQNIEDNEEQEDLNEDMNNI